MGRDLEKIYYVERGWDKVSKGYWNYIFSEIVKENKIFMFYCSIVYK